MSISLRKIEKKSDRNTLLQTIDRRLLSKDKGLGYWGAFDAKVKMDEIAAKSKGRKDKTWAEEISYPKAKE